MPNDLLLSTSSLKYHQDIGAELFENFFEQQLLKRLTQSSVIVMDNISHYGHQMKLFPNSNSTKAEIENFVVDNKIYFENLKTRDF